MVYRSILLQLFTEMFVLWKACSVKIIFYKRLVSGGFGKTYMNKGRAVSGPITAKPPEVMEDLPVLNLKTNLCPHLTVARNAGRF